MDAAKPSLSVAWAIPPKNNIKVHNMSAAAPVKIFKPTVLSRPISIQFASLIYGFMHTSLDPGKNPA